jgi:hypothetical protein
MRYLFFFLILASSLLSAKQSERYYQTQYADKIGGRTEVVMKDGTRCDIVTSTHAIEVDFARKWAEADRTEFTLRLAHWKKTSRCSNRTVSIR